MAARNTPLGLTRTRKTVVAEFEQAKAAHVNTESILGTTIAIDDNRRHPGCIPRCQWRARNSAQMFGSDLDVELHFAQGVLGLQRHPRCGSYDAALERRVWRICARGCGEYAAVSQHKAQVHAGGSMCAARPSPASKIE